MKQEFKKLFAYGVKIALDKDYLSDEIVYNQVLRDKYCDANGDFNWDAFYEDFAKYFKIYFDQELFG